MESGKIQNRGRKNGPVGVENGWRGAGPGNWVELGKPTTAVHKTIQRPVVVIAENA